MPTSSSFSITSVKVASTGEAWWVGVADHGEPLVAADPRLDRDGVPRHREADRAEPLRRLVRVDEGPVDQFAGGVEVAGDDQVLLVVAFMMCFLSGGRVGGLLACACRWASSRSKLASQNRR